MKRKIKLAVVDNQQLSRKGLVSLIHELSVFEVVIEAANGKELMEQLKSQKPDVLLLDVRIEMNGIRIIEALQSNYPAIKILVLSVYNDEALMLHLLEKGARGFLLKNNDFSLVADAVYGVMKNNYYFNEKISKTAIKNLIRKKTAANLKLVTFSVREIEIIRLICQELTNKEIASRLFISVRTVDGHKDKIQRKIKAKNVIGIVMYAVKNNLLD